MVVHRPCPQWVKWTTIWHRPSNRHVDTTMTRSTAVRTRTRQTARKTIDVSKTPEQRPLWSVFVRRRSSTLPVQWPITASPPKCHVVWRPTAVERTPFRGPIDFNPLFIPTRDLGRWIRRLPSSHGLRSDRRTLAPGSPPMTMLTVGTIQQPRMSTGRHLKRRREADS
jgi:hypothetical protein